MTPDTPTQAAALPPLPEPAIEDHPAELWGQNVLHDLFTADQMRAYAKKALQEACAERDALRAALKPFADCAAEYMAGGIYEVYVSGNDLIAARAAISNARKEGAQHAQS